MSKMLEFLESKFGFWLITTVLVAAATTANAFLQNYFVERQKKASQTEKISLEIEFRLSQYMAAIRQMTEGKNNNLKLKPSVTAEDVKAVTQILVGLPARHKDYAIYSVYPQEFGQRPLASLLAELATLKTERATLFREQVASLAGGALYEVNFSDPFSVASLVNRTLIHRAIAGDLFYTDCPPDAPLC